ncbi:HEAT repeat containing protein [Babesia caballi]|uniref:HEAT repeat containing protein n=1 Tax=Babesia caballi TaxID=5871 RepID=A0AAV4M0I0_BABCB|nr:HEAT repeat containing protein [Babesia caballi]
MTSAAPVKDERLSVSQPTRLPDPAALVSRKLMSSPQLSLSSLLEGTDAERAEKTQLLTLQFSHCHQSRRCDFAADAGTFCELLRGASSPLQVKVCELLVAYLKAAIVDSDLSDQEEGIRSSDQLLSFYRALHDDLVAHALPNVKAGDQCALFLCHFLSLCSSTRVFAAVVELFGDSVRSLLAAKGSSDLSAEKARRVIGVMKLLLFLTKAFGTPPAPSSAILSIASTVIKSTKTHLCRLYSYNVIAFLLRKLEGEEAVAAALPDLSAAQRRHVTALLKEANNLTDSHEWSFQYSSHAASPPVVLGESATAPAEVMTVPTEITAIPTDVTTESTEIVPTSPPAQPTSGTPMKPKVPEPASSISTCRVSVALNDADQTITPVENPIEAPPDAGSDAADPATPTAETAPVKAKPRTSARSYKWTKPCLEMPEQSKTAVSKSSPLRTGLYPPALPQDAHVQPFKMDWFKRMMSPFTGSDDCSKPFQLEKTPWKQKCEAIMAMVDHLRRLTGRVSVAACGQQLFDFLENILKFEATFPVVLGALRMLALLLEKGEDSSIRQIRSSSLLEPVFDRLNTTNHMIQCCAITCVAWFIRHNDGAATLEAIKKTLCHKSPLARIAMCNIISGSVELPPVAANPSQRLQCHRSQLDPLLELLLTDKNAQVRAAALECKRVFDDPEYAEAKSAINYQASLAIGATLGAKLKMPSSPNPTTPSVATRSHTTAEPAAAHVAGDSAVSSGMDAPAQQNPDAFGDAPAAPAKRPLVRRYLRRNARKQTSGDTIRDSRPAGSTDAGGDPDSPVPPPASSTSEAPPSEGHAPPATTGRNVVVSPAQSTLRNGAGVEVTSLPASSGARASQAVRRPLVRQPSVRAVVPTRMPAETAPPSCEASADEAALAAHIPAAILSKISRRGASRRTLTEGLYELGVWLQGHADLASALELDILRFVGACTNGFRETTRSGKAALHSFLEDFSALGISAQGAELLVAALSFDIANPKVESFLNQLAPRCDPNGFVMALLQGHHASEGHLAVSSLFRFFEGYLTSEVVSGLSADTVSAIAAQCAQFTSSDDAEVSRLSRVIMGIFGDVVPRDLDSRPVKVVNRDSVSPFSATSLDASPGRQQVPNLAVVRLRNDAHEDLGGSTSRNPISSHEEIHTIAIEPIASPSASVVSVSSPPSAFFEVPDKFNQALAIASSRLGSSVSAEIYACMFESSRESCLQQACAYWETLLQQPPHLLQGSLFGANAVRYELLLWLCHTLLRGACESQVIRCLCRLLARVKEVGAKLSLEESASLLDALSVYHSRNPGDALLLFDHLLQVADVTPELMSACPSPCVWRKALGEHMLADYRAVSPSTTSTEPSGSPLSHRNSSPRPSSAEASGSSISPVAGSVRKPVSPVETANNLPIYDKATSGNSPKTPNPPGSTTPFSASGPPESTRSADLPADKSGSSSGSQLPIVNRVQISVATSVHSDSHGSSSTSAPLTSTSASASTSSSADSSSTSGARTSAPATGDCSPVSPRLLKKSHSTSWEGVPAATEGRRGSLGSVGSNSSAASALPKRSMLPSAPVTEVPLAADLEPTARPKVVCDVGTSPIKELRRDTWINPNPEEPQDCVEADASTAAEQAAARNCIAGFDAMKSLSASTETVIPSEVLPGNFFSNSAAGSFSTSASAEEVSGGTDGTPPGGKLPPSIPILQEDDDEEYGRYPGDSVPKCTCTCAKSQTKAADSSARQGNVTEVDTAVSKSPKREAFEVGIQTTPAVPIHKRPSLRAAHEESCPTTVGAPSAGMPAPTGPKDVMASTPAGVVESARSSISSILSRHLHCDGLNANAESTQRLQRYMSLVEVILSDCSYISNFCLLSNYQDYHAFVPSIYDEEMVDNCVERARRILDHLSMFPDQQVVSALSPVLLDACHVSILRLCKEIEGFAELSMDSSRVLEAIVCLVELFTIASQQLSGRSLLQYCAVVIHCLALPKDCFHRNVRLYNGLSRLISANALEQGEDVLARLLVICVELCSQSLRRGDGGRILLAILRLTRILQVQTVCRLQGGARLNPEARGRHQQRGTPSPSPLRHELQRFQRLVRRFDRNLRPDVVEGALEPRLGDPPEQLGVGGVREPQAAAEIRARVLVRPAVVLRLKVLAELEPVDHEGVDRGGEQDAVHVEHRRVLQLVVRRGSRVAVVEEVPQYSERQYFPELRLLLVDEPGVAPQAPDAVLLRLDHQLLAECRRRRSQRAPDAALRRHLARVPYLPLSHDCHVKCVGEVLESPPRPALFRRQRLDHAEQLLLRHAGDVGQHLGQQRASVEQRLVAERQRHHEALEVAGAEVPARDVEQVRREVARIAVH